MMKWLCAGVVCLLSKASLVAQKPGGSGEGTSSPGRNVFAEALRPVPPEAIFRMEGYYLWDPSVIKVGDTYHLFASRWPKSWGAEGWKKCHVIRAISKNLFGPYEFAQVVMTPEEHPWAHEGVHNPKIMRTGNRYVLYHIGIPGYTTGMMTADKIEGPWTPFPKPVIPTNNPALMQREDGSFYAVGKFKVKPPKDGSVDDYMDAYASSKLEGPYEKLGDSGSRLPHNFELEDPTLWWANGQYNVVCLDWEGKATGVFKAFTYYTSTDGIRYRLHSEVPLWHRGEAIPLTDGSRLKVTRLERPQVFLDENKSVIALLAGAQPENRSDPWILIIRPVAGFRPGK